MDELLATIERNCWLTIDDEAGAYYLRFDSGPGEPGVAVHTVEIVPGSLMLDFDRDGRLLGLEFLDPRLLPEFRDRQAEWIGEWMNRKRTPEEITAHTERAARDKEIYDSIRPSWAHKPEDECNSAACAIHGGTRSRG
jgi:Protein of unknown function (DUF2283)